MLIWEGKDNVVEVSRSAAAEVEHDNENERCADWARVAVRNLFISKSERQGFVGAEGDIASGVAVTDNRVHRV